LIICAGAIYLSCEWFVNAVEWLGRRLNVAEAAVGTVLAAFGTALPESAVTLVAVTTGGTARTQNIGVGAAMGGPLALATVAYAATGLALLERHRRRVSGSDAPAGGGVLTGPGEIKRLARDQRWFLAVFAVKVALGLVAFAVKPWLGLAFFATYAVYFWREMRRGDETGRESEPERVTAPEQVGTAPEQVGTASSHVPLAGTGPAGPAGRTVEDLEPLKLRPGDPEPPTWAILVQNLAALAVIFVASRVFVTQLDAIGPMLGLPAGVTALLLSPIATELPETMNAIIWVRQGKTRLALANISGAMMIQATVPSGLGLLFTPWRFDGALAWSGLVTMAAIGYLLVTIRARRFVPARLAWAGAFYVIFAIGLVPILS
jgi:cation:H+ antiporter